MLFDKISRVESEPLDGVTETDVLAHNDDKHKDVAVRCAALGMVKAGFGNL